MSRRPYRPLVLLAGAFSLSLCLVRPALADPIADYTTGADIVAPTSAQTEEAPALPETTIPSRAAELGVSNADVEVFEAALPPDIPALAVSADEAAPAPTAWAALDTLDFDVALFEAGLPHDIPAPAHDGAIPKLTAASPHPGKPPLKSAAIHPRKKTPAVKQPLRSAAARGKTIDAARAPRPAFRSAIAAAPPATIAHVRPRVAKADHGPRELFIARLPPDDRDEVMPALRVTPVLRGPLPPPALALK